MSGIGTAYRIGGDEFVILAHVDSDGKEIAQLAAAALHEQGDRFDIACSYGLVLLPTEASSSNTALHLADQRMYEQKSSSRSSTVQHEVTDALVKMLNEHANGIEAHVSGVAALTQQLAVQLRLQESEVSRITTAARLHDVGKSAIPHTILNKAGSLDKEEWEFMRRHTLIGERIMLAAPSLAPVASLVRSSHERWDGSGYPDRLASDQIPLGSRIISVCDAFDPIVSGRPYAEGRTVAEALGADNTVVDQYPSDGTGSGSNGTVAWGVDVGNASLTTVEPFTVYAICALASSVDTSHFASPGSSPAVRVGAPPAHAR